MYFRDFQAMVMTLEVNFKGNGESSKNFMSLRDMIFVIEIKRLKISLWKGVDKGHYSNGLMGLLQELPSSLVEFRDDFLMKKW